MRIKFELKKMAAFVALEHLSRYIAHILSPKSVWKRQKTMKTVTSYIQNWYSDTFSICIIYPTLFLF